MTPVCDSEVAGMMGIGAESSPKWSQVSYFQAGEFKCNSARICCVKCLVIKTPQHWLMISLRGFTTQDVGNDYHL